MKYSLPLLSFLLFLSCTAYSQKIHGIVNVLGPNASKFKDVGADIYLIDSQNVNKNNISILNKFSSESITTFHHPFLYGSTGYSYILNKKHPRKERKILVEKFNSLKDSADSEIASMKINAKNHTLVDENGEYEFQELPSGAYYILYIHKGMSIIHVEGDYELKKVALKGKDEEVNFE